MYDHVLIIRCVVFYFLSVFQASEANKSILAEFRQKHNISPKEHSDMLQTLGWNAQDFAAGFKG